MCLAVPGKLLSRQQEGESEARLSGIVDFQGTRVKVGLAFVPEAQVGDWLLVHAGFAISRLDEAEAHEVWELLQPDELPEELPPPPAVPA